MEFFPICYIICYRFDYFKDLGMGRIFSGSSKQVQCNQRALIREKGRWESHSQRRRCDNRIKVWSDRGQEAKECSH